MENKITLQKKKIKNKVIALSASGFCIGSTFISTHAKGLKEPIENLENAAYSEAGSIMFSVGAIALLAAGAFALFGSKKMAQGILIGTLIFIIIVLYGIDIVSGIISFLGG